MVEINKMFVPAAIAGAAVAVFTTVIGLIPIVQMLNLACCLWLAGGGVLAVYLLKKDVSKIELKDGAIIGALSGVFYAIIATIFSVVLVLLGVSVDLAAMQQAFQGSGIEATGVAAIGFLAIVIGFVLNLVLGVIFGAIGGVIGAKLLGK